MILLQRSLNPTRKATRQVREALRTFPARHQARLQGRCESARRYAASALPLFPRHRRK